VSGGFDLVEGFGVEGWVVVFWWHGCSGVGCIYRASSTTKVCFFFLFQKMHFGSFIGNEFCK